MQRWPRCYIREEVRGLEHFGRGEISVTFHSTRKGNTITTMLFKP